MTERSRRSAVAWKVLVSCFISGLLLLYLIRQVGDPLAFSELLSNVRIAYILMVIVAFQVVFFFRSMRLGLMVGLRKWRELLSITLVHNFLNRLLPFSLGEISMPILLRKSGRSGYTRGALILLISRLADFFVIMLLFTIAYYVVRPSKSYGTVTILLSLLTILSLASVLYVSAFIRFVRMSLSHVPEWLVRSDKRNRLLTSCRVLLDEHRRVYGVRIVLLLLLSTLFSWVFTYLIYDVYLCMFSVSVGVFEVVLCSTFATVAANLPFVNGIGRFGSFELGWTAGFVAIGHVAVDVAVPIALFINVMNFVLCLLFAAGGYIHLMHSRGSKLNYAS